ncbi:MAG: glycogen phosphorylase [Firmicutes bacterium HGW-Firmicutes-12]|jgi:starch phosphorylase|nr:MAG: glycogen phosphorylase [Firmicutes bacterium HGW-Firmicutes-12]
MFMEKEGFKKAFQERFLELHGEDFTEGNRYQYYRTLASLVRDEISRKWNTSKNIYSQQNEKRVYYFSIEFLPGRFLLNYLHYLGIEEIVSEGLDDLAIKLEEVKEQEEDPGLGNGGLGRLASAFLDSLASLGMPGFGCGIRYRYGLFEQLIVDGEQTELPDNWLHEPCVWEYRKPEKAEKVRFGGSVTVAFQDDKSLFTHENYEVVKAIPYDIPIIGYRNNTVNNLRLWSAETDRTDFEFHTFSHGEYGWAFHEKIRAEAISQVLYPDDSSYEGKELRLKQQYFFVSAGLQSIIHQYKKEGSSMKDFHKNNAIHINDTHPALAVAELMRILIDEEGMNWAEAWSITTGSISYTNHTLLPEALERWGVELFRRLLPRIYMLVEEINTRFCGDLINNYPELREKVRDMAIISDGNIKMANLAIIGSHSVNGVARLHTEILKKRVMNNFHNFYPTKFNNKTNGISQRRWLPISNPSLSRLLTEVLGDDWINKPMKMEKLATMAEDGILQEKIAKIKQENKLSLAHYIFDKQGIKLNPDSIFDIHIKRIHMYKRQLLNVFHIIDLYNRLYENPELEIVPRTFIFGGKAAPAYFLAKRVIKLINSLAQTINHDRVIREKIKVVFLENYNVSLAELAFPAADVSEQISTASKEASGTGNMKFMMNGAVTIGTLDGANVEIREKVGADNFIAFGLSADEVLDYYTNGDYKAWDIYNTDERVHKICNQLVNGVFDQMNYPSIYDHLLHHNDDFFVLRDFATYVNAQNNLQQKFRDRKEWIRMCINNIAYSGSFSSDRTIREYAEEIWGIKPIKEEDKQVLLPRQLKLQD